MTKNQQRLNIMAKALYTIEDVFEYKYKSMSKDDVRVYVYAALDKCRKRLKDTI